MEALRGLGGRILSTDMEPLWGLATPAGVGSRRPEGASAVMRVGYRGLAPTAKFRRPLTGTCEAPTSSPPKGFVPCGDA